MLKTNVKNIRKNYRKPEPLTCLFPLTIFMYIYRVLFLREKIISSSYNYMK